MPRCIELRHHSYPPVPRILHLQIEFTKKMRQSCVEEEGRGESPVKGTWTEEERGGWGGESDGVSYEVKKTRGGVRDKGGGRCERISCK